MIITIHVVKIKILKLKTLYQVKQNSIQSETGYNI